MLPYVPGLIIIVMIVAVGVLIFVDQKQNYTGNIILDSESDSPLTSFISVLIAIIVILLIYNTYVWFNSTF